MKIEKIKNIEFLRVYFILGIILFHMFCKQIYGLCAYYRDIHFYSYIQSACSHCNNCVEGFFIISGVFLVLTFNPQFSLKKFIIRKYFRFMPTIFFSLLICLFGAHVGAIPYNIKGTILSLFLLNHTGFYMFGEPNNVLWFVSVLFQSFIIYFCIIKYLPLKLRNIIITCIVITSYSIILYLQHGSFVSPLKSYFGFLNIHFLRGLGGVGLGCIVAEVYKHVQGKKIISNSSLYIKILFTIIEFALSCYILWWTIFPHKDINNIRIVVYLALILLLFLLKRGYISQFFNKNIWASLGKYIYSIYVTHFVLMRIICIKVLKNNPEFVYNHAYLTFLIYLFVVICFGVLTYYLVELPCAKYLKNKFDYI